MLSIWLIDFNFLLCKTLVKLHFLHLKFFEYIFYTLNYDICYTLHVEVKFAVNLDKKRWHHMKIYNAPLQNPLKTKDKLHFTILNYTLNYIFHHKL